jgi:hypothetical protein
MTVVIPVSAEWLTLREDADARARSQSLAAEAARMVSSPVTVHDLGSGTGSMMRWLAPRLPGRQTWVLHDWNADLLEQAADRPGRESEGRPTGVRTSVEPLGLLSEQHLAGASLVTTSALLDVVTREEVEAIVRACVATGAPTLFSLSVTGRVMLDPPDPGDRVFSAAFNLHQRRTADGRRLLGPDAVPMVTRLFRAAGWEVQTAESPWRLTEADSLLVDEWMREWLTAAVEVRPALREWAAEYARARRRQLATSGLRLVVQHEDVLACPP